MIQDSFTGWSEADLWKYTDNEVIQKEWKAEKSLKSKIRVRSVSCLRFIPESQDLPDVMDQAHQLEPVWCEYERNKRDLSALRKINWTSHCRPPLSGCSWRMPSAVWKAWKELGKSTSGSDSSTSWSRDTMASIIPICVWLNLVHSEDCREMASCDQRGVYIFILFFVLFPKTLEKLQLFF